MCFAAVVPCTRCYMSNDFAREHTWDPFISSLLQAVQLVTGFDPHQHVPVDVAPLERAHVQYR